MLSAHMKNLGHVPIAAGRRVGAWVCLSAAMLLWAPAWGTAFLASRMTCCTGTMCAAHGHADTKGASKTQSTTQQDTPMECNHGSQTGLMACRMSCCHNQDRPLTGAVIFVLPEPMTISAAIVATPADVTPPAREIGYLFEPPSPPPRSHSFIA
jgi:hypothetical protein